MSATISRLFIVEGKVVFRTRAGEDLDSVLRRSVRALGDFRGAPFAPEGRRAASFLRGDISATRISLGHPQFTEESGAPNSWLSISIDAERSMGVVFLGIHLGPAGEQVEVEWSAGLEVMPRLVTELAPTVAFMNGRLVDVERSALPSSETYEDEALPEEFVPWNYVEKDRLSADARRHLNSLPAARSEAFGSGWVVQTVVALLDPPPAGLVNALKTVGDSSIRYRGPIVTAAR